MPDNPLWEYARRSLRNLGGAVDWLAGGAQAGAEPALSLYRGDDLDQPLLPSWESGGRSRLGAVASALNSHTIPGSVPAGSIGTYGGIQSRVPNKRQLSSAKRAADRGMGADEIRARYGWFQAPDADWKFEIPDSGAKLTPTPDPTTPASVFNSWNPQGYKLDHPELIRAYPELKQYRIGTHSRDENMAEAFHDPTNKYISLASDLPPDEALKSLIHELQHGVQTIEGFNPGASPWSPVVKDIANERFNRIYSDAHSTSQEFNGTLADWTNQRPRPQTMREAAAMRQQFEREHPELTQRYKDALSVLDNPSKHLNEQKFQTYQRALGETEARDASQRMNMTPEQRALVDPYYLGRIREVRTPFDPADDIDLRAYLAGQKKAADVPPEQAELVRGMAALGPDTKALIARVLGPSPE